MKQGLFSGRAALLFRDCLPAAAVLLALLALTLWYAHALGIQTDRWVEELDRVEQYARLGDWDAARSVLAESRRTWTALRPCLQAASRHDAVDAADALYVRCTVLAAEEGEEVLPELAELRRALGNLADMERLCLRNIL